MQKCIAPLKHALCRVTTTKANPDYGTIKFQLGIIMFHCCLPSLVNGSLTRVEIAHISKPELDFEYCDNESDITVWPEGIIPPDGTPLQITNQIYTAILVLVYISAIGCTIFALVCLVFNIAYRKRRYIL